MCQGWSLGLMPLAESWVLQGSQVRGSPPPGGSWGGMSEPQLLGGQHTGWTASPRPRPSGLVARFCGWLSTWSLRNLLWPSVCRQRGPPATLAPCGPHQASESPELPTPAQDSHLQRAPVKNLNDLRWAGRCLPGSPEAEEPASATHTGPPRAAEPACFSAPRALGALRLPQRDLPTHASSLLSTSRSWATRASLGTAWLLSTASRKSRFPKHSFLHGVSSRALLSP